MMMIETRLRVVIRRDEIRAVHRWSKKGAKEAFATKDLVLCFALLVMPLIPCTLNREIINKRSGIKKTQTIPTCSLAHNLAVMQYLCAPPTPNPIEPSQENAKTSPHPHRTRTPLSR